jgi:hypothetical protein
VDDEVFDARRLLIRAHEEEAGRTFHRKMDQVLGHADIQLFDAHASVREQDYHSALRAYAAAYKAIGELQTMLESTIKQLISHQAEGNTTPFKPTI